MVVPGKLSIHIKYSLLPPNHGRRGGKNSSKKEILGLSVTWNPINLRMLKLLGLISIKQLNTYLETLNFQCLLG